MNNVSFCGAKVFANPNMFIKNAKASEIAEAINIGVKQASEELGQKLTHARHQNKISGALLKNINPDSFDKQTQKLSEAGKKGFDRLYGFQFDITSESKLKDLIQCAKNIAKTTSDDNGVINYGFQYLA